MTNINVKLHKLLVTIRTLRGSDGCPWDKRQTCHSLQKHLRSELDELLEAIINDDPENICEELGDLLYLILMISEINKDANNFTIDDVITTIDEKLIRRHPHVFAGSTYENEEELSQQWKAIKAAEKEKKSV